MAHTLQARSYSGGQGQVRVSAAWHARRYAQRLRLQPPPFDTLGVTYLAVANATPSSCRTHMTCRVGDAPFSYPPLLAAARLQA